MSNLTILVPEGTISWQLLRENFTSSSSTAIAGKLSTFIKYWRIANVVLYVVIFVTSAVGNGLVCFIIIRRRSMKSVVNYLILNLAIADLIFTCVCIPLDIPVQQMNYVWPYGGFMCKVIYPLQTQILFASVYTLFALSLTRYRAVVHPLKQQLTTEQVKWVIVAIWVVSFLPVSPYMATLRFNRSTLTCEEYWTDVRSRRAYTICLFLFQYVVPLTVISCTHLAIAQDLNRQQTREITIVHRIRVQEGRKVSRMLIIVTLLFAVCVLPNNILWLWLDFGEADKHFAYFTELLSFGNIVVFLNSALNPVCYTMMNDTYTTQLRDIIHTCLKPTSQEEVEQSLD